ncbi:phospholipid phosphatase 6 [Drosophila busckii]|uniref:phospholipid phosphatase 6 n=1 Tax=Drosophila busckii TaxID=30019 RepID=UPI0014329F9C|nr:phospholipid phosphatase 6 [Drosophila busckii]
MTKLKKSSILQLIAEQDIKLTNRFVHFLSQFSTFRSLRIHSKILEVSCNGIAWLVSWIIFIWLTSSQHLHQVQVNMLVGLLLDILIIAVLKSLARRRRPVDSKDMLTIGPDKFSFPSGHASRAFYVLFFFTKLITIPVICWMPITVWALSVVISRIILRRHYILDVIAGALIGICEALFLQIIWISDETAISIVGFLSEDKPFSEVN